MNFESIDDRSYFYAALFHAVLYAQNIKGFITDLEEQGIRFIDNEALLAANRFFSKYAEETKISQHSIKNIYEFANYCRFDHKANQDRERIFSHCNEMMGFANRLNQNPSENGYISEIRRRYANIGERTRTLMNLVITPKETKEMIHYAIELDFWILFTHSVIYDEDDFKFAAESMLADPVYLYCIERFLYQRPQLFQNKVFVSRVLSILKTNDHMLAEMNGEDVDECIYEPSDDEDIECLKDKVFIRKNRELKQRIYTKKDS